MTTKKNKNSDLKKVKREWKEWIPEILGLFLLASIIIWLVFPSQYKSSLYRQIQDFISSLLSGFNSFLETITNPSTLLGLALFVIVIYLIMLRVRYHLKRFAVNPSICPVCSSPINQRHRRLQHRILSIVVPVRRYSCLNCGWKGLKIYQKNSHGKK